MRCLSFPASWQIIIWQSKLLTDMPHHLNYEKVSMNLFFNFQIHSWNILCDEKIVCSTIHVLCNKRNCDLKIYHSRKLCVAFNMYRSRKVTVYIFSFFLVLLQWVFNEMPHEYVRTTIRLKIMFICNGKLSSFFFSFHSHGGLFKYLFSHPVSCIKAVEIYAATHIMFHILLLHFDDVTSSWISYFNSIWLNNKLLFHSQNLFLKNHQVLYGTRSHRVGTHSVLFQKLIKSKTDFFVLKFQWWRNLSKKHIFKDEECFH